MKISHSSSGDGSKLILYFIVLKMALMRFRPIIIANLSLIPDIHTEKYLF